MKKKILKFIAKCLKIDIYFKQKRDLPLENFEIIPQQANLIMHQIDTLLAHDQQDFIIKFPSHKKRIVSQYFAEQIIKSLLKLTDQDFDNKFKLETPDWEKENRNIQDRYRFIFYTKQKHNEQF